MNRLWVVVAVWSLSATVVAAEKVGRTRDSANGAWSIRLVEVGPDQCRVEVLRNDAVAWTLPKCVGTIDDYLFISDTGETFWVLRTLPETPPQRKGDRKAPHFRAVVAVMMDREGRPLKTKRLEDFVARYRLGLIRQLDRHFKWLEGVFGVPGKGPRMNAQGEVEFETVATKTYKLKF
jgi:hypothetical protein